MSTTHSSSRTASAPSRATPRVSKVSDMSDSGAPRFNPYTWNIYIHVILFISLEFRDYQRRRFTKLDLYSQGIQDTIADLTAKFDQFLAIANNNPVRASSEDIPNSDSVAGFQFPLTSYELLTQLNAAMNEDETIGTKLVK